MTQETNSCYRKGKTVAWHRVLMISKGEWSSVLLCPTDKVLVFILSAERVLSTE